MARVSPVLLIPPIIFAALAALFLWGMERGDPTAMPSARAGGPVPALTVTPLGDQPEVTEAMLKAPGMKLVNFWASWCVPCRAEHADLEKLAAEGITIYGINYKDKPANALDFLHELGNPFHALAADTTGRTGLDWGIYGVPETFVVDGNGKIVLRFAGPLSKRSIDSQIRPALAGQKVVGQP